MPATPIGTTYLTLTSPFEPKLISCVCETLDIEHVRSSAGYLLERHLLRDLVYRQYDSDVFDMKFGKPICRRANSIGDT